MKKKSILAITTIAITTIFSLSLILFLSGYSLGKDDTASYQYKFKNKEQFVIWLNKNGHTAEYHDVKYYQVLFAVDGGVFRIDDKLVECYLYDNKEKWENFKVNLKKITGKDNFKLGNYYNVRCLYPK